MINNSYLVEDSHSQTIRREQGVEATFWMSDCDVDLDETPTGLP